MSGVVVSSGGVIVEWNGADIEGLTLQSGAVVIDDELVSTDETVSRLTVSSGALVQVDIGGVATRLVVASGGELIGDGGTVSATVVHGGGLDEVAGIERGATLRGATASGAPTFYDPLSYAFQDIDSNGSARGTRIQSGGWETIEFGASIGARVTSGGRIVLLAIGELDGATLSSGAELDMSGAGKVQNLNLRAGAVIDLAKISATSVGVENRVLRVMSGAVLIERLGLGASSTGLSFALQSDGAGGTDIVIGPAAARGAEGAALIGAAASLPGDAAAAFTPATGGAVGSHRALSTSPHPWASPASLAAQRT